MPFGLVGLTVWGQYGVDKLLFVRTFTSKYELSRELKSRHRIETLQKADSAKKA
jgi:hypothetical protein